jgi:hypothetical protein
MPECWIHSECLPVGAPNGDYLLIVDGKWGSEKNGVSQAQTHRL